MNPFRGLLDLLTGGRKADKPEGQGGNTGENPVPTLKEILAAVRSMPRPSEARPPMPTPPTAGQMAFSPPASAPPPTSPTPAAQVPPPAPTGPGTASGIGSAANVAQSNADGLGRLRGELQGIAKSHSTPPAPTESRPPLAGPPPAPITVSPPAVNVTAPASPSGSRSAPPPITTPAASGSQDLGRHEGMLSGFVAKLSEVFGNLTANLASLITGLPKDATAAGQGPGNVTPPPAGVPPAPTGTEQQPSGNWRRHGGKGPPDNFNEVKGGDFQPKEPESEKKASKGIFSGFTGLIGTLALAKVTFNKTINAVERFVMGTQEANKELRYYSGELAVAFANLDIQELQQNMRTAQRTGGSGSLLASEIKNLKDEFQPLREMNAIFKNKLAANFVASTAAVTKLATDAAKLTGLVGIAEDIEKNTRDRSRDNREPGVRMAQELASGAWTQIVNNQPLPPIE